MAKKIGEDKDKEDIEEKDQTGALSKDRSK